MRGNKGFNCEISSISRAHQSGVPCFGFSDQSWTTLTHLKPIPPRKMPVSDERAVAGKDKGMEVSSGELGTAKPVEGKRPSFPLPGGDKD